MASSVKTLLLHRGSLICLFLIAATILSWDLAAAHGGGLVGNVRWVTTIVMVIAFVKVRFVIQYIMEADVAPLLLRILTEAWVVIGCAFVLRTYWLGAP